MASITADTIAHRFMLATNSYKQENEIHLVNYSEDLNRIELECVYGFGYGEMWSISPSPYDK